MCIRLEDFNEVTCSFYERFIKEDMDKQQTELEMEGEGHKGKEKVVQENTSDKDMAGHKPKMFLVLDVNGLLVDMKEIRVLADGADFTVG